MKRPFLSFTVALTLLSIGLTSHLLYKYSSVFLSFEVYKNDSLLSNRVDNTPNLNPSRAVIHMGIHKTGSTSIQQQSHEKMRHLKLDGYEMPWAANQERNIRTNAKLGPAEYQFACNQVQFATCFIPPENGERKTYPCNPDLLLRGLEISKRNHDLFVSAETFSNIDSEGVNMLASYLSNWDEVTIIVYYRRFYSWIASVYNEMSKKRKLTDTNAWERSIVDFVLPIIDSNTTYGPMSYTSAVVQRLKERFDNVVVMNMHDGKFRGSDESFFCHALPNANHTCQAVRLDKFSKQANAKTNLDYNDLVYGAKKASLVQIKSDKQMSLVVRAVQKHQEKTLKLKSSDFQRLCLPPEAMEKLWQISLRYETMLFPEQINSTTTSYLRSDFDKLAQTTLCKVDVEKVLGEERWQSFFLSMKN